MRFLVRFAKVSRNLFDYRIARVLIHIRGRLIRHRKWPVYFTRMFRMRTRTGTHTVRGASFVMVCYRVSSKCCGRKMFSYDPISMISRRDACAVNCALARRNLKSTCTSMYNKFLRWTLTMKESLFHGISYNDISIRTIFHRRPLYDSQRGDSGSATCHFPARSTGDQALRVHG